MEAARKLIVLYGVKMTLRTRRNTKETVSDLVVFLSSEFLCVLRGE
jgi:hypothetical protein